MTDRAIPLHGGGDKRAGALEQAILELIYERGAGLPFPAVIGVLRLIEHRLITEVEPS